MILGICPKDPIPPREGGGVIPNEVHVVEIVVSSTRIKRDEVQGVDRNIVAAETRRIQGIHETCCTNGSFFLINNYLLINKKHSSLPKSFNSSNAYKR